MAYYEARYTFDTPEALSMRTDYSLDRGLSEQNIIIRGEQPYYMFLGRVCEIVLRTHRVPELGMTRRFVEEGALLVVNWADARGLEPPFRARGIERLPNNKPLEYGIGPVIRTGYILEVDAIRARIAAIQNLEPQDFIEAT